MDALTKEQKDEYATAYAILALYDGGVSTSLSTMFFSIFFSGVEICLCRILRGIVGDCVLST